MPHHKNSFFFLIVLFMAIFCFRFEGYTYQINDKLLIGGVLAGAYQYEDVSGNPEKESNGGGAIPFQPEMSYTPTDQDEIFFKFGFAAGNGLNNKTAFNLAPWAAYLEDDVLDINGRNRSYLLTSWYKHTFEFSKNNTLGFTFGIIDSTDYLDENAYANDEFTQFMNECLVIGPNAFSPSFDIGGAFEWAYNALSAKGVVMQIGENDDGNEYTFVGVQLAYTFETSMGKSNYRIIGEWGSDEFLNPEGNSLENREIVLLSFDQQFCDIIGGWIRFGWGSTVAAVNYSSLYSGGINISGRLWGREQDNLGIG